MAAGFNDNAKPKAKVEYFKIYIDTSNTASPSYELQGKGVGSWTLEQNQDINKEPDVLGLVEMDRSTAQPVQSGVEIKVRKDLAFSKMLYDAWKTGDMSRLDSVDILQKFEFDNSETTGHCNARRDTSALIAINSFNGEAGGYLTFDIDIHYSNNWTQGHMAIEDPTPVVFTPDT